MPESPPKKITILHKSRAVFLIDEICVRGVSSSALMRQSCPQLSHLDVHERRRTGVLMFDETATATAAIDSALADIVGVAHPRYAGNLFLLVFGETHEDGFKRCLTDRVVPYLREFVQSCGCCL